MTESDPPFEVKYHKEKIRLSVVEGEEYCSAFLPETIHQIGLEQGDYVDIEKVEPEDGPVYLKTQKVPEEKIDTRKHYKIRKHQSRHYLTIPKHWQDDLIEQTRTDMLVVEINFFEDQPELRVYNLIDYFDVRKPELEEKGHYPEEGEPIALPLTTWIWTKIAGDTTQERPEHKPSKTRSDRSETLREGFGDDIDDEPPATSS
jgi:hypothetical protein